MFTARMAVSWIVGFCLVGCSTTGPSNEAGPSEGAANAVSNDGSQQVGIAPKDPVEVEESKWPNGNPKSRTEGYKDPDGNFVRHGVSTVWYENAQKKSEQHFVDGVPHGPRKTWYIEGRPWTDGRYVNGLEDGTWRTWFPDGTPQTEWTMQRGVWHGVYSEWHTNGKKRLEVEFVRGKRQGPLTTWDDQGVVVLTSDYVDGIEQP